MKRTRTCLVLALIILIGLTPSIQYITGKNDKPKKPKKKAKEIRVALEYVDNGHYAPDTPIEGVAWVMYDGLDVIITSGITLADGIISFIVLMAYDQTGDGIHIEFMWRGTLQYIMNIVAGTPLVEEYNAFNLQATLTWDGTTPLPSGLEVDFYSLGEFVGRETVNGLGIVTISQVIAGTYTLNSTLFSGLVMVIPIDHDSYVLEQSFTISAEFKLVSSFLV